MDIVRTRAELEAALQPASATGQRIAFVPTMGFLHEGHLTLVDLARQHGDVVVMSIYVNPLQFGPAEDLARYPRDLQRDAWMAEARGVDVIFAPPDEEMYSSSEPAVTVHAPALADRLCGRFRPGHFEGVLTVVAKLFNLVHPHVAIFGQKDFQQFVLVRRMCSDLSYDVEIVVAPIVREPDGLAMSSRNVYLSAGERTAALALSRALRAARLRYQQGERNPQEILRAARDILHAESSVQPQYLELVDAETLDPPERVHGSNVLAVAAFVGKTRLIDNVILGVG